MPFFLLLFVSTAVLFCSAALMWWRMDQEKRRQQMVVSLRQAVETQAEAGPRPTVLTARPRRERGWAAWFRPEAAPAGAAQKGWSRGGFVLLTTGAALAGWMFGMKLVFLGGSAATWISAAAFGSMPWMLRARRGRSRLTAFEDQFPEALDFVARSVRAGNAFSIALELLAAEAAQPLKAEILIVTREMALGATLEDSLHGLTSRVPLVEVRFFVSAVLLQRETGGNLSEVLGKLALSVRERLRLRSQVKAASGQGRLTATVLTILPIATLIVLRLLSPEYMSGMTEEPIGRNLLAAAAVSQIIGYIVMKKITKIEV